MQWWKVIAWGGGIAFAIVLVVAVFARAEQCMGRDVNRWVETRTHTETICLQWNEPFPDDPTRCEEYAEYFSECVCIEEQQVEVCRGIPLFSSPDVDVIMGSPCDDFIFPAMGDVVCAGEGDDTIIVHGLQEGQPIHIDSGPGNDYVGCSGQAVCLGE